MRNLLRYVMASCFWFAPFAMAQGQTAPQMQQGLGLSQAVLQSWNEVGRKLIAMAEDFPESKYDFKPTPEQRSFAEQLLHVAGSNDLFTDVAKGQKPADDEERSHYKSKQEVVAYLRESFSEGAAVIKQQGERGMTKIVVDSESKQSVPLSALAYELIEHSGEHYGQLAVYYRVAGLAPPESRPHH